MWNPLRQISGCWEWASSASAGSNQLCLSGAVEVGGDNSGRNKLERDCQEKHTVKTHKSVCVSVLFILENRDKLRGNWGALLWLHVSRRGRTHSNIRSQSLNCIKIQVPWQNDWQLQHCGRCSQSTEKKRVSASHTFLLDVFSFKLVFSKLI